MRTPQYLSPSSLSKYEKDVNGFYFNYCAEPKPPRDEQSLPASVGSAFDAFVKADLEHRFLGGQNRFEELFESQVIPKNRDFAKVAGSYLMDNYVAAGSYQSLVDMIKGSQSDPQFEFTAEGTIEGIPLVGKPDCRFVNREGAHVILDWKVNGYCGRSPTSPKPGYRICLDGIGWDKHSRTHNKAHNLFIPTEFMGLTVNQNFMEGISIDWADQLTIYGWLMGEPIGAEEVVLCIEQFTCKPTADKPLIRIATHCSRVSSVYQHNLLKRLKKLWDALTNKHIFQDFTLEESLQMCEDLDVRAKTMCSSDGSPEGDFFANCVRPVSFYKGR